MEIMPVRPPELWNFSIYFAICYLFSQEINDKLLKPKEPMALFSDNKESCSGGHCVLF